LDHRLYGDHFRTEDDHEIEAFPFPHRGVAGKPPFAALKLHPAGAPREVLVGAFRSLARLDLRTGKLLGPEHPLPAPVLDWSADGRSAVLAATFNILNGTLVVTSVSSATGKGKWTKAWREIYIRTKVGDREVPGGLPLVTDLDGDGKPEILGTIGALDGST